MGWIWKKKSSKIQKPTGGWKLQTHSSFCLIWRSSIHIYSSTDMTHKNRQVAWKILEPRLTCCHGLCLQMRCYRSCVSMLQKWKPKLGNSAYEAESFNPSSKTCKTKSECRLEINLNRARVDQRIHESWTLRNLGENIPCWIAKRPTLCSVSRFKQWRTVDPDCRSLGLGFMAK